MKKAALLSILVVAVQLAVGVLAQAQQTGKIFRIGFPDNSTASSLVCHWGLTPQMTPQIARWSRSALYPGHDLTPDLRLIRFVIGDCIRTKHGQRRKKLYRERR